MEYLIRGGGIQIGLRTQIGEGLMISSYISHRAASLCLYS
jgi:hypothetical protein